MVLNLRSSVILLFVRCTRTSVIEILYVEFIWSLISKESSFQTYPQKDFNDSLTEVRVGPQQVMHDFDAGWQMIGLLYLRPYGS
jgi:hypothetical protein